MYVCLCVCVHVIAHMCKYIFLWFHKVGRVMMFVITGYVPWLSNSSPLYNSLEILEFSTPLWGFLDGGGIYGSVADHRQSCLCHINHSWLCFGLKMTVYMTGISAWKWVTTWTFRQFRTKRVLTALNDVPLRTRKALSLCKVFGNIAPFYIVLNGTFVEQQ